MLGLFGGKAPAKASTCEDRHLCCFSPQTTHCPQSPYFLYFNTKARGKHRSVKAQREVMTFIEKKKNFLAYLFIKIQPLLTKYQLIPTFFLTLLGLTAIFTFS
ncbi:unnamed protein product [Rangifer tarandus platyrhynchus]|uniref:Uncharacterized protein n=2 Tax=Rangifer tarandus platyrhynchus TaxID=3082113 RepID=A0ABN8ZYE2_RANTA|nr:unnamed protein product [Rangifer tarandus platyrhynchus]